MSDLTVISCDDCGLCCEGQGMPPGYQLMLSALGDSLQPDDEDKLRWQDVPEEALFPIVIYMAGVASGEIRDPGPCCWLDPVTRRCRWYEHRPQICRDYEMGGESCLVEREQGKAACGKATQPEGDTP